MLLSKKSEKGAKRRQVRAKIYFGRCRVAGEAIKHLKQPCVLWAVSRQQDRAKPVSEKDLHEVLEVS